VEELVAAHDGTFELLHSGDFVVRTRQIEEIDVDRYLDVAECRMRFSGERQRLTQVLLAKPRPEVGFYTDAYSDGKTQWMLHDYDRTKPLRITPLRQHGAGGSITTVNPGVRAVFSPLESMLLHMHLGPGSPSTGKLLRQFVAAFPRAEVAGQETVEGDACWKLRLSGPAPSLGLSDAGDFVELMVAPSLGFRVKQKITNRARFPGFDLTGQSITIENYRTRVVVKRFREFAPGLFLPLESEAWVEKGGQVNQFPVARCDFQVNSVNEPIPEEAFQFEFPEYLRVADLREGSDKLKLYIWDKGNKPGVQFTSTNDLTQFEHLERPASGWKAWAGGIAVLVAAAALGTLAYRKYRKEP
jgi:hypothetical protein